MMALGGKAGDKPTARKEVGDRQKRILCRGGKGGRKSSLERRVSERRGREKGKFSDPDTVGTGWVEARGCWKPGLTFLGGRGKGDERGSEKDRGSTKKGSGKGGKVRRMGQKLILVRGVQTSWFGK